MNSSNAFPQGSIAAVGLPLGNPADITRRAVEILGAADIVAAEDTRNSGRLLKEIGSSARLVSYHDWNEAEKAERLLGYLKEGLRVALVSDAGTPGVSDPGYDLIRLARKNGLKVFPVPGPCALTAFVSVSGLPTNAFTFLGFPPNKKGKRRAFYKEYIARRETLVFYESPRRAISSLIDGLEIFGEREAALAREMTKPYEEFIWGSLSEIITKLQAKPKVLGEIVWGVRGAANPQTNPIIFDPSSNESSSYFKIADKLGLKEAAREMAREKGVRIKDAYAFLLARKPPSQP